MYNECLHCFTVKEDSSSINMQEPTLSLKEVLREAPFKNKQLSIDFLI